MVDFKTLDAFVAIVRHGSFRIAADRLATTQPALSARIAKLEASLGVLVLTRGPRGVVPTDAGRILLDHTERLLAQRAELIAAVAAPASRTDHLRLGVAETIVHTWLPRFLAAATEMFPRLSFEIEVDVSPNLRDRLTMAQLDMGFLIGPTATPALIDKPLCRFDLAFLASPALKITRRALTLSDVATQPIITFARNTQPYVDLVRRLKAAKIKPPRLHASASVATIARMARDGLGVALLPPATVRDDLNAGRLVRLAVRPPMTPLTFVVAVAATADRTLTDAVGGLARHAADADRRKRP